MISSARPYGLLLNETIMPEYLKQLGYSTHMVGKVLSIKKVTNFIVDDRICGEFDSWQCQIHIPCSLSLRLLGSFRGSLGTYNFIVDDRICCEFDSWLCQIYIPCPLSLRLLGSFRGSLGTYGLTQKLC